MGQLILAVSFAMGVSAFCSLFEAVLYSVPLSYVEAMARKGRRAGVLFKRMREDVERPISAVLTLNTVANTFGASVAGAAALAVFGKAWLGVFSAAFTLGILLCSEIVPKTLGVRYSKGLSSVVAFPLYVLQWVLSPATWATSLITRWLGTDGTLAGISAEEIAAMAKMGHRTGAIRSVEETVIRNILALRDVRSRDIMTPRTVVFSLPKQMSLKEVRTASSLWPWPHSRIPIYEDEVDNIIGLARRREILAALADDRENLRLADLMKPVHIVPDTLPADRLLKDFIERREHLFVVVDEYGGVVGVVTLEDVFEEILGQEIVDETDLTDDLRRIAQQRRRRILGEDDPAP